MQEKLYTGKDHYTRYTDEIVRHVTCLNGAYAAIVKSHCFPGQSPRRTCRVLRLIYFGIEPHADEICRIETEVFLQSLLALEDDRGHIHTVDLLP